MINGLSFLLKWKGRVIVKTEGQGLSGGLESGKGLEWPLGVMGKGTKH